MAQLVLHGQTQLFNETSTGPGSLSREVSSQSDSILITLWCAALTGTLTVTAYTLTDTGKEVAILTFPVISAPTSILVLKRAPVIASRVRVEAVYTGIAQYEIYARAINSGLVETKIVGSTNISATTVIVGSVTPVNIIPAALTDRSGIVIKNWSTSQTVYLAESSAAATLAAGYPLAPKDALAIDLSAGVGIYMISDAPGADIRILQSGG